MVVSTGFCATELSQLQEIEGSFLKLNACYYSINIRVSQTKQVDAARLNRL